ncbi:MAG: cyclopropane fatty acyl phospholipid synthase [Phycisphaerales bacterium]|nr:cyclopropane fatty acyl phospholipid synthase [Phycisphaerales bacterium]
MGAKRLCEQVLGTADIRVNGDRPWDIHVRNEGFYDRAVAQGTLGLGESYMDGWWECDALDEMVARALRAGGEHALVRNWRTALHVLRAKVLNLQTRRRATRVARRHYDIDDELYMSFLDPYGQYTCAYFKGAAADDLDRAQQAKMDLICRKIGLRSGDRVLDIGCGWGGLARWMHERHGCRVTGVNIAEGQLEHARRHAAAPEVEFVTLDYRDLAARFPGAFDKVVSVGMVEHVGWKNHRRFFRAVRSAMKADGLFLLQTCGQDTSRAIADPWIDRYIFPNGCVPSPAQLTSASEGTFVLEDWHNMGAHYDHTLMNWWRRFERAWPRFRDRHGERFFRMFRYYMLSCAGAFRARQMHLFQAVFSPAGVPGGYESVR